MNRKPTSVIPELSHQIFDRISSNIDQTHDLIERDYLELHTIFGSTFEAALNIIDTKDIIIYRPDVNNTTTTSASSASKPSTSRNTPSILNPALSSTAQLPSQQYREICEITSKNYNAITYKLFPNINYCQCTEFQLHVIGNISKETKQQYTCKHCLALKLALILNKYQIQIITKDQFNFLIKQIV